MQLRNGKKYSFKPKQSKKKIPKYIKNIVNFLNKDFMVPGYDLVLEDYNIIKD